MELPKGPKLELKEATETAIEVEFVPDQTPGVQHWLQWKEHPAQWESAEHVKSVEVPVSAGSGKCKAVADPLQPGTTYCVRMVLKDGNGQSGPPGADLIIDTEQVGCTPKSSSTGCGCTIS